MTFIPHPSSTRLIKTASALLGLLAIMTGSRSATGSIPVVTFNFNALVFKPSSQDFESPKTVEQCRLPCIAVQQLKMQLPEVYSMLLQGLHPASPHHDSLSPCCTELSCLWLMLQSRCKPAKSDPTKETALISGWNR